MKLDRMVFRVTTTVPTLAIACSSFARQITVKVGGQVVLFRDAQPQLIEGAIFVPIRGVLEQMGATIDWDQA